MFRGQETSAQFGEKRKNGIMEEKKGGKHVGVHDNKINFLIIILDELFEISGFLYSLE